MKSEITGVQSNVATLGQAVNNKIDTFYSEYSGFKSSVTGQVSSLETNLNAFSAQSQQQFQSIAGQISKVESKSKALEEQLAGLSFKTQDFSKIIEKAVKAVVSVRTNTGVGSGVIVDERGYVVTNYHVIDGATSAGILTYDKELHQVALVAVDVDRDLALLQIFNGTFTEMGFADSDMAKVGQSVLAIGNPGGLDFTVTEGIVSAVNREINGKKYIQTDVPINPGNSGGPLVDTSGRILGINQKKISGFEGVGFAIPADDVKAFVRANLPASS
ncbi:MAG: trypsin-like peptidase domain-containing protein [Candidatus Woesearchaeota archaeon]